MKNDPRFSGPISASLLGQPATTGTDVIDNRRPIFEIAIAVMLMMQFCFLLVLGWRMMLPTPTMATVGNVNQTNSQVQTTDDSNGFISISRSKLTAYQEVLDAIAKKQLDDPQFVERYVQLQESNAMLNANLRAQMMMTEKLDTDCSEYSKQLQQADRLNEKLSDQLQTTRLELKAIQDQMAAVEKNQNNQVDDAMKSMSASLTNYFDPPWWLALLMAVGILVVGGAGGFFVGRHRGWQNLDFDSASDESLKNV